MADEELQEPENPDVKKKKKSDKQGGSIPLPLAIGVIVGVLIVGAMINFVLMKFVINPAPSDSTKTEEGPEVVESDPLLTPEDSLDRAIAIWKNKSDRKIFETERITTNPRGSKSIVVLKLSVEYFMDVEKLMKLLELEEADLGEDSQYMNKIKTYTTTTTISMIGERNEDFLLNYRDSLATELKERLTPYYDEKEIFLIDIKFTEYIVQ